MLTHTRSFRIWLVLGCALLGVWLLLTPLAARAATISVDTAIDESDGSCSDGDCSLRDAIALAASGDTITFADDYTIYLSSTLTLAKAVTIDGSGHTITISGDTNNDGSPNVRAFYINSGVVVTLRHLTITRCYHSDRGAGVYNYYGTLNVIDSTLSNNAGGYGGGAINNYGGLVTIQNSTLSGNSGGYGGAILMFNGTVIVQNSVLSGNGGSGQGGAIQLYRTGSSGSVTVLSSTLVQNYSWYGGGIYVQFAPLVVQNSLFLSNTSRYAGGGIYYDYDGIGTGNTDTIDNSTFIGNAGGTVYDASVLGGGALYHYKGTLTVRNSTFSNNSAPQWQGGGIVAWGTATILNSTIISSTSRTASSASGLVNFATLYMQNTIIAGGSGPDCSNSGIVVVNSNNLIEDGSCSTNGVNFMSGDPLLGPLADNGGPLIGPQTDIPLQTHALLPTSPAIDAGNAVSCLPIDQRGETRDDLQCDIGAFELKYPDSSTVIRSVSDTITTTFGPTLIGLWRDTDFADPGVITVTRGAWGQPAGEAIAVRWDIKPTVTSGFSLTLQACYTPTELNGLTEDQLRFWRSDGITFTQLITAPVLSTINGYHCASLSGIDQLSRWTLAVDTPTAVTLNALTARATADADRPLMWLLATGLIVGGFVWRQRRFNLR